MNQVNCKECGTDHPADAKVCPACGAPPMELRHRDDDAPVEGVRTTDLEPYVGLRYIARLFKVLAALLFVMMLGEIVLYFIGGDPRGPIVELLGVVTRLLVLAGLMWGGGDLAILLIDAGHDIRVARILLGRINHELHRASGEHEERSAQHVERAPR